LFDAAAAGSKKNPAGKVRASLIELPLERWAALAGHARQIAIHLVRPLLSLRSRTRRPVAWSADAFRLLVSPIPRTVAFANLPARSSSDRNHETACGERRRLRPTAGRAISSKLCLRGLSRSAARQRGSFAPAIETAQIKSALLVSGDGCV